MADSVVQRPDPPAVFLLVAHLVVQQPDLAVALLHKADLVVDQPDPVVALLLVGDPVVDRPVRRQRCNPRWASQWAHGFFLYLLIDFIEAGVSKVSASINRLTKAGKGNRLRYSVLNRDLSLEAVDLACLQK